MRTYLYILPLFLSCSSDYFLKSFLEKRHIGHEKRIIRKNPNATTEGYCIIPDSTAKAKLNQIAYISKATLGTDICFVSQIPDSRIAYGASYLGDEDIVVLSRPNRNLSIGYKPFFFNSIDVFIVHELVHSYLKKQEDKFRLPVHTFQGAKSISHKLEEYGDFFHLSEIPAHLLELVYAYKKERKSPSVSQKVLFENSSVILKRIQGMLLAINDYSREIKLKENDLSVFLTNDAQLFIKAKSPLSKVTLQVMLDVKHDKKFMDHIKSKPKSSTISHFKANKKMLDSINRNMIDFNVLVKRHLKLLKKQNSASTQDETYELIRKMAIEWIKVWEGDFNRIETILAQISRVQTQ